MTPSYSCRVCANIDPTYLPDFPTPSQRVGIQAAREWRDRHGLYAPDKWLFDHLRHLRAEAGTPHRSVATRQAVQSVAEALDPTTGITNAVENAELETDDLNQWLVEHGAVGAPGMAASTVEMDGEGKITRVWHRLAKSAGAPAPVVRQAEPVNTRIAIAAQLPARRSSDLGCGFVYGDSQIGWVLDDDEQWIPTHDESAIDVCLQILGDVEAEHGVNAVVNLGDHLDLPGLSKHRSSPSAVVWGAVNKAIDSAYRFDAAVSALTPNATRHLVSGNHDERFTLSLIDKMPQLVGLRRAGEKTDPVISIPFLLRHEETGWQMSAAYPTGEVWLNDGLRFVHGPCVRPTNNATSDKYLNDRPDCSTIYGHTHRPGFTYKVYEGYAGSTTRMAGSPGCLARVDGVLPSARGGHSATGRPTALQERWGQGVAIVFYKPSDGSFTPVVEHVQIHKGVAYWRGREYRSRVDVNGRLLAS